MTPDEKIRNTRLRCEALDALKDAEHKMHKYAADCELGKDREFAFEVYERIRTATRIQSN